MGQLHENRRWATEDEARRKRQALTGQRPYLNPLEEGPGGITFIAGAVLGVVLTVLTGCGLAACGLLRIGGLV